MDGFSHDRAAGVLLGQACGDALGVPYEFGPALPSDFIPQMVGGELGPFAPGEYSDDTSMAVCIAEVAATGEDLTSPDAIDQVARNFLTWAETAKDIGNQTRAVFSIARRSADAPGLSVPQASQEFALTHPRSAGNGALMRTAIVALSRVDDREATANAARTVAATTHADPLAVDSCALWTEAVRVAVTRGELDLLGGLDLIPDTRREQWRGWIDDATGADPRRFNPNGYTVTALQAAWAAITSTPVPELDPAAGSFPAQHFQYALMNAVRAGHDTDTVAAIAGGLLGARWGWSAIPSHWSRRVHGYGGHRARGLVTLGLLTVDRGKTDEHGWPTAPRMSSWDYRNSRDFSAVHPHDDGVILGTYATSGHGCDAVVSLCRMGAAEVPAAGVAPGDHVEIRLLDKDNETSNRNLDFVMADAGAAIKALRDEGKRVFVHCVAAEQRTPTVAIAYSRILGIGGAQAQADVKKALPGARGYGPLWDAAVKVSPR